MPRTKKGTPPRYCEHKQSGQAFVLLNGRQIMLGEYGSGESRAEYRRVLGKWEANGRQLPEPDLAPLTVGPRATY